MNLEIIELNKSNFTDFLKLLEEYKNVKLNDNDIVSLKNDIFNETGLLKVLLGRNNNELIGFMFLVKNYSVHYLKYYYFLSAFFIKKTHRSQGYGSIMFNYLINFSKENNLPRISWTTDSDNTKAQKFYDKYNIKKDDIFYKLKIK